MRRENTRLRIYDNMNVKTEKMSHAADSAVGLLQSLGNKSRLMIMCQLIDGEKSVGQLAELLQAREFTVSQHLALLRKDPAGDDEAAGPNNFLRHSERSGAAGA